MLIELLRPAGPELARRWLAALLMAPEKDRPQIVAEVERRIVSLYAEPLAANHADADSDESDDNEPPTVHLVSPPVKKPGFVETTEREYVKAPDRQQSARRVNGDARSA